MIPEKWLEAFDVSGLCSYRLEDFVIEDYAQFLQQKAAKDPPSSLMTRYAAVQAKRVIHIPIGSLSPVTVKKIRVVHLLAGRDKRSLAKDYIW